MQLSNVISFHKVFNKVEKFIWMNLTMSLQPRIKVNCETTLVPFVFSGTVNNKGICAIFICNAFVLTNIYFPHIRYSLSNVSFFRYNWWVSNFHRIAHETKRQPQNSTSISFKRRNWRNMRKRKIKKNLSIQLKQSQLIDNIKKSWSSQR